MKKLLLLALLVLGTNFAKAQENRSSIFFGYTSAKATGKLTNQYESESETNKARGFHIGVSKEYKMSSSRSIETSIIYTNLEYNGNSDRTHTLQLPVFLKYYLLENIALLGGPKVEYIMNTPKEANEYTNDFSISLGLGIEYFLSDKASLILNYSFQLSNSYNNDSKLFNDTKITAKRNFMNFGFKHEL